MWPSTRVTRSPGPGEVHVWACPLDLSDERTARLRSWLSEDEADREVRFRRDADRRRFVVAHGLLRDVLGRYLGCPPAAVVIASGRAGKPVVRGPVRFSFSHGGEMALVAVASGAELGVDVELLRCVGDRAAAAELALPPATRAALGEGGPDEAFLRAWSRREAYVKGRGDGVFAADEADRADALAEWSVRDLDPAPGYVGALAVGGCNPTVRWERLEP